MKKALACLFILTAVNVYCQEFTLTVENPLDKAIADYIVEIPANRLDGLPAGNYVAQVGDDTVPVEFITDIKARQFAVFPIPLLVPRETKTITIRQGNAPQYPKRTYAELANKIGGEFEGHQYKGGYSWVKPNYLRVPDNFRDHAYYIKYEGPGWESDRVGFRFYLDPRNAIDVFGKKTPGIVLPFVGVDGYDNYHNMADWGMDNMKVGKSLGIGSIAVWDGERAVRVEKTDSVVCYIPADGKIRSQVMTRYYGWEANGTKCDLQSLISIDAGSRASHIELLVSDNSILLATGIIINEDAEMQIHRSPDGKWACINTFGKQSLNDDNMGLAVFVRTKNLYGTKRDDLNHVILLRPEDGYLDYYIMPTWELDWEPVITRDDFRRCINEVFDKLSSKISIK